MRDSDNYLMGNLQPERIFLALSVVRVENVKKHKDYRQKV